MTHRTRCRILCSAALAVASSLVCGCGSGPVHYPVAGKVTLDGKPVPDGEVILIATDGAPPDAGRISDGRFEFMCLPGEMRVEITAVREHPTKKVPGGSPGTWVPAKVNYIPARYRGVESELQINIPTSGNQQIAFDLQSDPTSN